MLMGIAKPKKTGGASRLYEAGAAILFFGVFSQSPELKQAGTAALAELAAQGYQVPDGQDPVRVYPVLTQAQFSTRHAGAWLPGNIYLRSQPEEGFNAIVYLRHELFHEASFRSCGGRLPKWAEEAAAMRFSSELIGEEFGAWPSDTDIQRIKTHIKKNTPLDNKDHSLLKRLAANSRWPKPPCSIPAELQKLLER